MPDVKLWSPSHPDLYDLDVGLVQSGEVVDSYSLKIGVRTIRVDGDRLLLNDQPIYLQGFGRHEDFPVVGRGYLPALIVKDYALMQWMGANSFRTTHYPYSEQMLDLADRLGFLVIDETPAVGLYFREDGWATGSWGNPSGPNNLGIYKGAQRASDLTIPGPTQSWVYMDEHPDSINDAGAFAPNTANNIPDAPATYHNGAAGFAFADGHSEIHKWRGRTMTGARLKGFRYVAENNFGSTAGDSHIYWYSYVSPRLTTRTVVP